MGSRIFRTRGSNVSFTLVRWQMRSQNVSRSRDTRTEKTESGTRERVRGRNSSTRDTWEQHHQRYSKSFLSTRYRSPLWPRPPSLASWLGISPITHIRHFLVPVRKNSALQHKPSSQVVTVLKGTDVECKSMHGINKHSRSGILSMMLNRVESFSVLISSYPWNVIRWLSFQ